MQKISKLILAKNTLKMKKIFIITQHFPPEANGRATRIFGLAKFLEKFHNVTVIAPPPTFPFKKYKQANYFYKKEEIEGIKVVRLWTLQPSREIPTFFQRFMYQIGFPLTCSFFLLTRPFSFNTIIASVPPPTVLFSLPVARLFKKKIILDIGDLEIDPSEFEGKEKIHHPHLKKFIRNFQNKYWKNSSLILTNNLVIQEEIQKKVDSNKVEFLPFLVDLNEFQRIDVPRIEQIVYIGSFSTAQHLEAIIKAMPKVTEKFPNLKLKLYGGGEDGPKLKKLVKDLKIDNNCIIYDAIPRKEISKILSKSLMGIVALVDIESLHHATPIKTFEYLACGLPVFGYGPSDALEGILTKANAGIHVKGNDPEKIANELIKILDDKKSLEQFSLNGRKYVEKHADYSRIAEMM